MGNDNKEQRQKTETSEMKFLTNVAGVHIKGSAGVHYREEGVFI
jgi:hypothetical protein